MEPYDYETYKDVVADLNHAIQKYDNEAATWDLETTKHLVVLNAAGVAGVATLLAGQKSGLYGAALLCFVAGVVFAVLHMHLVGMRYRSMTRTFAHRRDELSHMQSFPGEKFSRPLRSSPRWISHCAGSACRYLSAACALFSTSVLAFALLR